MTARTRTDALAGLGVALACVLLGAPAGLLWAAVSPRVQLDVTATGISQADVEGKASVSADGTLVVVLLALGVLTGLLAWRFARRSGPGTVLGLLVGGLVAAKVASSTGLLVGDVGFGGGTSVLQHLRDAGFRGHLELYLGRYDPATRELGVRSVPGMADGLGALTAWPVAALSTFLVRALVQPEEVD